MRNSVKIASVLLFLGAFAASIGMKHSSALKPSVPIQNREPTSIPPLTLAPLTLPQDAEVTSYHYERAIRAEMKQNGGKPLLDLFIRGTFFLTELRKKELGRDGNRFVNVQFELTEGDAHTLHESQLPFVVEISPDQNIRSIRSAVKATPADEDDYNVMRDFIGLFAYQSNRDSTGIYDFKIEQEGNEILKRKLNYAAGLLQSIAIQDSRTHGRIDENTKRWIQVEGHETSLMSAMGKGNQSLVTTSSFKIERTKVQTKPKFAMQSFDDLQTSSLVLTTHAGFATRSWKLLKLELSLIKNLSKPKRLALFHDLVKLLKSDPSAVREFRKSIEAMASEPGLMTFGIGVLATAGSSEAQGTLIDWYQGKYGVEHTVLNAFSTANAELTPETRGFLKNVLSQRDTQTELAQNAAYALGSSLKRSNDEETRSLLSDYYTSSQNAVDRMTALDAMGNSGDAHFLPTLKTAAQSANVDERAKAVFGARFLPGEVAAPILQAGYQDSALAVKNASVRALAFQENLSIHAGLIHDCASAGNSDCQTMLKQLNQ